MGAIEDVASEVELEGRRGGGLHPAEEKAGRGAVWKGSWRGWPLWLST